MSFIPTYHATSSEEGLVFGQPKWYSKTSFNNNWFGNWVRGWIIERDARAGLPVGVAPTTVVTTGEGISELGTTDAAGNSSFEDLPEIDRRDIPQNEETVFETVTTTEFIPGMWELINGQWIETGAIGSYSLGGAQTLSGELGIPGPLGVQQNTGDNDVGVFSDIYDTVDSAVGGWLPGGVPVGSSLPGQVYNTTNVPATTQTGPVVTGPVVVPNAGVGGSSCNVGSPVYKKVHGVYKWVYPKRRRRKALVTKQDIKGLAALKGVLGQGKAMETWIATHS